MTLTAVSLDEISRLYETYGKDLAPVRDRMRGEFQRHGQHWVDTKPLLWRMARTIRKNVSRNFMRPNVFAQLDDICAELTYLLLREARPDVVVEFSPCDGWSTQWILSALNDNQNGHLWSFDLVDNAAKKVPKELAGDRWTLVVGDVRKTVEQMPNEIDYLFIDSDHSREFAEWYFEAVLPKARPGAVVSIDDIFHHADPGIFDGEGPVVIDWLRQRGIDFISPAPANPNGQFAELQAIRQKHGFSEQIKSGRANPTIFFKLPAS